MARSSEKSTFKPPIQKLFEPFRGLTDILFHEPLVIQIVSLGYDVVEELFLGVIRRPGEAKLAQAPAVQGEIRSRHGSGSTTGKRSLAQHERLGPGFPGPDGRPKACSAPSNYQYIRLYGFIHHGINPPKAWRIGRYGGHWSENRSSFSPCSLLFAPCVFILSFRTESHKKAPLP